MGCGRVDARTDAANFRFRTLVSMSYCHARKKSSPGPQTAWTVGLGRMHISCGSSQFYRGTRRFPGNGKDAAANRCARRNNIKRDSQKHAGQARASGLNLISGDHRRRQRPSRAKATTLILRLTELELYNSKANMSA
jgi:hypothetical protein